MILILHGPWAAQGDELCILPARLWTRWLVKSTQASSLFVIKVLEPLYCWDTFHAFALTCQFVERLSHHEVTPWEGSVSAGNNGALTRHTPPLAFITCFCDARIIDATVHTSLDISPVLQQNMFPRIPHLQLQVA